MGKSRKEKEKGGDKKPCPASVPDNMVAVVVLVVGLAVFGGFLSIPVVGAENVSVQFADTNLAQGQHFELYKVTGGGLLQVGEFNTTDNVTMDSDYSYVVVLKPSTVDYWNNPVLLLDWFVGSVPKVVMAFVIVLIGAALIALFMRWGRR